jgi:membrane-bound ClpP family serine protease
MTGIVILILLGLFLFIVEFLLVPGVTVAGIGGLACLVGGVFWAYSSHGNMVGHITLISTIALTLFTVVLALRSRTWKRFMLDTNVEGSVASEEDTTRIKPGDEGLTISRLSPMGKARINDLVVEARSTGQYIDPKTKVVVIRFEGSKVIVKPKID